MCIIKTTSRRCNQSSIIMKIELLKQKMLEEKLDRSYIDLCYLYAFNLNKKKFPIIFDFKHFSKLLGIDTKELYGYYSIKSLLYKEIFIPKKTGGVRLINAPSENLKFIQRWLLDNILKNFSCSEYATGFLDNKSIVDNAKKHINKECIINLDIKDFFPSIKINQVYNIFRQFGYTKHLSLIFAGFTTFKDVLPQGSPASPYLSNITCFNLDKRLGKLANKINADYSRYADDITFSGNKEISKYIPVIKNIVKDEKFNVNEKKLRVHYKYHRQMVTGIIVNKKLSVPKKTKHYLRQQIYYCKKFGVDKNMLNQGFDKSNFKGYLFGIANFVKMVEPEIGLNFIKELEKINWDS